MDGIETLIDPHNEVRKLQELVKKLERQNEVLRSKQDQEDNSTNPLSVSGLDQRKQNGDIGSSETNTNNNINVDDHDEEENHTENSLGPRAALDDFDDVDVSNLSVEVDSWLYAPTNPASADKSIDELMSWVRQDFDHPSPDVESSKRSLISKLDEAARMKHSASTPLLGGSHLQGSRSASALSRSAGEGGSTGLPARFGLQRKSGLAPPGRSGGDIDTGTFTRPKRGLTNGGGPPCHGEGDQVQDVPAAPNVEDIENLAKQQEEHLRQSITPSSRKGYRSKQALVEGDSARLSPSRFDMDGMYLSQHRGSLGSDHSTPPDSPLNNQHFSLNNSADGRGGVRRGSGPVSNLQYNRSHNSSDSSLERHSVNSDEFSLAPEAARVPVSRLQQPSPRGQVPRRSGLMAPQQSRGLSPQRTSGLPTPRRQIARPVNPAGARSSLPTYRRTNIPSPKPMCVEAEENWREGCF